MDQHLITEDITLDRRVWRLHIMVEDQQECSVVLLFEGPYSCSVLILVPFVCCLLCLSYCTFPFNTYFDMLYLRRGSSKNNLFFSTRQGCGLRTVYLADPTCGVSLGMLLFLTLFIWNCLKISSHLLYSSTANQNQKLQNISTFLWGLFSRVIDLFLFQGGVIPYDIAL